MRPLLLLAAFGIVASVCSLLFKPAGQKVATFPVESATEFESTSLAAQEKNPSPMDTHSSAIEQSPRGHQGDETRQVIDLQTREKKLQAVDDSSFTPAVANQASPASSTQEAVVQYAEIEKSFARGESLALYPDLVQVLNQTFFGSVVGLSNGEKFADFSLSIRIEPPQNNTHVLFEITDNQGEGRFDSNSDQPDEIFKVVQSGKKRTIIMGLSQQWYIELQIADASEASIQGRFYRKDGYVGILKFN